MQAYWIESRLNGSLVESTIIYAFDETDLEQQIAAWAAAHPGTEVAAGEHDEASIEADDMGANGYGD